MKKKLALIKRQKGRLMCCWCVVDVLLWQQW